MRPRSSPWVATAWAGWPRTPTRADYAAYAITDDERSIWTEGMERYLVREG